MTAPVSTSAVPVTDLSGKRILVTGGSAGLGAAIVRAAAASGASVAINCHIESTAATQLVEELVNRPGKMAIAHGDVTLPTQATRAVQVAADELGGLDGLVLNAHGMPGWAATRLADLDVERRRARDHRSGSRGAVPTTCCGCLPWPGKRRRGHLCRERRLGPSRVCRARSRQERR